MDALYSAVAALAMGSPFMAILGLLAYYYLFCVPSRRNRKSRKRRFLSSPSSNGLGTVVLGLTLIYRPRILHAVEAQHRQVEDADEDDNGNPDPPKKHLMRQLRRIRRGEEVDVLSVRLR